MGYIPFRRRNTEQVPAMDLGSLSPCTHGEADTRIIQHAARIASQGFNRIAIKASDSHVLILSTAFFEQMPLKELWISFMDKHIRVHAITQAHKSTVLYQASTLLQTMTYFLHFVAKEKRQHGKYGTRTTMSRMRSTACQYRNRILTRTQSPQLKRSSFSFLTRPYKTTI